MRSVLVPLFCGLLAATACAPSDPLDTEALRSEANKAVQAGDWDTAAAAYQKLTEADPTNGDAWHMLGFALHSGGKIDEALPAHLKATKFPDVAKTAAYNAACAYALKGDKEKALEWLENAMGFGFAQPEVAEVDPDLASLRGDPRFQALLRRAATIRSRARAEQQAGAEADAGGQE